ncbi:MAG: flagellar FliJ family protein [Rickettsiaceae bacterium]|nr:flagellar FliJ family protein [Rickettsiaceae bacterium]
MKTLNTLIKLQKSKLNSLRTLISRLETQIALLEKKLTQLQQEKKQELEEYVNTKYSYILEQYLTVIDKREYDLNQNIQTIAKEILNSERKLHTEYSELKKYEIALKNKLRKEFLAKQKLETNMLDEISITRFSSNKL